MRVKNNLSRLDNPEEVVYRIDYILQAHHNSQPLRVDMMNMMMFL